MISVKDLKYAYGKGKLLDFPDFSIEGNGQCLLLGESGSGKTTLLHLIGGLLRAQRGLIDVNQVNIAALSEAQLDHFRGEHMGFIFQKSHLITALTVKQNVMMAPFLGGLKQEESRVEDVLAQLGLAEKQHSKISELSHGQAQRVAIARAVVNKPSIILADEPTSALDDTNCDRVIGLLVDVARANNACLLIATHDHRLKSKVQQQIIL